MSFQILFRYAPSLDRGKNNFLFLTMSLTYMSLKFMGEWNATVINDTSRKNELHFMMKFLAQHIA